jgi:ABC-type thiamine transport system substrate-binding protein
MKLHFLLIAFLVLVSPLLALAQTDQTNDDQTTVKRVVEDYLSKKDLKAVERSLSADAKIISVDGRRRVVETLISKPSKQRADVTTVLPEQKITAIDVTEGGASVKVESEFSADLKPAVTPRKHIQYISLLKVGGEWKIVSILMPPIKFAEVASK